MAVEYSSTPTHLQHKKPPALVRKFQTLVRTIRVQLHRWRGGEVVHFIHVGKTGGSALKYMLLHSTLSARYRVLLHRHRFGLADMPPGDKAVLFLRDPVTRFESGFWDRMRQGRPLYNVPWTGPEATAFQEFKTPNELALALSDSDLDRRQRAQNAMRGIRHVADHYGHWLRDPDYVRSRADDVLFIGRSESLESDSRVLGRLLGMTEPAELPSEPTAAHRRPLSQTAELDPQAVSNLRAWYASDYEILAACEEIMASRGVRSVPEIAA